jgi:hypoxanthine phosphoribosyltransferase
MFSAVGRVSQATRPSGKVTSSRHRTITSPSNHFTVQSFHHITAFHFTRGAAVRILLGDNEIREGVRRMGQEIQAFYGQKPLTVIGVMTGSVMFLADLLRELAMPLRVGVIQARSYRDRAAGKLVMNSEFLPQIAGRDILIVDDIFDTGQTLLELTEQIRLLKPKSVRLAVLLTKVGRQQVGQPPDHVGFEIPNDFVVGYGLDYRDAFRHLPYIAILEEPDRLAAQRMSAEAEREIVAGVGR